MFVDEMTKPLRFDPPIHFRFQMSISFSSSMPEVFEYPSYDSPHIVVQVSDVIKTFPFFGRRCYECLSLA